MLKKIISTFGIKVLIAVLNLVIVIVLSNYIGASGKGEASLVVISMAMVMLFCNLLGGPTLIYLTPRYNIFLLFFLSNCWSLLTAICAFIVLYLYGELSLCMISHISLLSLINSFLATNLTILLAKERVTCYNLISLLQTALTLIVVFVFFKIGDKDVLAYIYALYIAMLCCLIISTGYLLPYLKKPDLKNLKENAIQFLKLGFTNQTSQIIKFLSFRVSYYMLMQYAGSAVLGVFSNGTSLIESLLLISNSFVAVLYPKISNSMNKKYSQLLTQQMTKMSIAFCLVALVPLVLLPSAFWVWLFGAEFNGVRLAIVLLAPGIVFYNISMVINHYFSGLGRYRISTLAYFIGLMLVVICSLIIIPQYGIAEAAIISSLSYIATALFYMFYFSKDAKISVRQLFPTVSDIPWFFKRIKAILF
ncbi:MAG TPA: polysaccharide biosynthesis C-terminal domain-containing protein [Bacteroidia bacterium]|nr:polysaccharide biosynthesis C-terminal domain-containing protein [Bacteroidia bacterium]